MSGLKLLRNRIKSVQSTQKITKAMRMVSASKLHKAKESEEVARNFRDRIISIILDAKESADHADLSLLDKAILYKSDAEYNNTIAVVYSSDRGLCGPYNSALYRKLRNELYDYPNLKVICVGKKIYELLNGKVNIVAHLSASSNPGDIVKEINNIVISELHLNPLTRVIAYYTRFKNTLTLIPDKIQTIPIEGSNERRKLDIEFEGDGLIQKLIELYLESNIIANLYESKASEEASRMTAMENATRNAGEMITALTLKMNRTRQAQITKELIEVISGAEAI